MDAIAAVCRDAGTGYVVLTTKHCDGFCLWPTRLEHPRKGRYHARRDIVGELGRAVVDAGMRMGLYYSGGYDWPTTPDPEPGRRRARGTRHPGLPRVRRRPCAQLIARYHPSVLWNDVCWPAGGDLAALFASTTTQFPTGHQ